jgi:hypothetical protein
MLQETNGKTEPPAGPLADRSLGRAWRALEEQAKDLSLRADPSSHVTEKRPETVPSRAPSTQIGLRLRPAQLTLLDAWIARQSEPDLKRPEAIRRLLERAFEADSPLAEAKLETLRESGRGEVRVTRLRNLVEELLAHGMTDAASQATEIIRSIERGESAVLPAPVSSET